MSRGLNEVIFSATTAISARSMYPVTHPKFEEARDRLLGALEHAMKERKADEMTFLVVGEDLVEGDRPIRQSTLYIESFLRALKRHGVERVTFARGITVEELAGFLAGMSGAGDLQTTTHLVLGKVRLELDSVGEGGDGEGEGEEGDAGDRGPGQVRGFSERDLDVARGSFVGFRTDRQGSIRALDSVMWHLMEGMGRASRNLLLLAPLKGVDDRAFVHAINVSLLVLMQGRSLGIGGQPLHDLGMAALLHDIGKLSLPPAIVQKKEPLDEKEAAMLRQHPELGAVHLSGVPGTSTLAVLVAYEHHLRWDGKPSYPVLRTPRRPGLASQLTAVADTYDLAHSRYGNPRGAARARALQAVAARSGTFLNPALVQNFSRLLAAD